MDFDPNSITQDKLHELRQAAEQAWGDDTRHPDYQGHPQASAGQCYVTSRWLQSKLGGHVGVKNGHYFWLSPDKKYAVDLTGDQFSYAPHDPKLEGIQLDDEDEPWTFQADHNTYRPGPVLYKRADHPIFKGARAKEFGTENPRVRLFGQRADAALEGRVSKTAEFGFGGDAYPGETGEVKERINHDEPEPISGPEEYKFFYGNGKLEVSPYANHDDLRIRTGVDAGSTGPMAAGDVRVVDDVAEWTVSSNLSRSALESIFDHYGRQAGWTLGSIRDGSGNEVTSKKRLWWGYNDQLLLSERPWSGSGGVIDIHNKTASVKGRTSGIWDAFEEWADDFGYRLAANDNNTKPLEDLEIENLYTPNAPIDPPAREPLDDSKPQGPMSCPECGYQAKGWTDYITHRKDEQRLNEPENPDGGFPELDMDVPLKPHFHEREPIAMPLAAVRVASWDDHFDKFWGHGGDHHYGAFVDGELVGVATITPGSSSIAAVTARRHPERVYATLIARLQQDFPELDWALPDTLDALRLSKMGFVETTPGLMKWAAGKDPKDMIDAPLPFVFDIDKDQIFTGQPGERTGDVRVPGGYTAGGIVEGFYEPGGHIVITTQTDVPYSTRHMLDLWYWSQPHMQITGLSYEDQTGSRKKLARTATDVGSYVKTVAMADPAAWNAYKALKDAGGKVYVVGGAVRDALLQKEPHDIDLMVTGVPSDKVNHILGQLPGKVDLTGKDFGVFRYKTKGAEVEVALPRSERSTGDRRVDFDVSVDHKLPIESDLLRRDFTVNAMAVDLDTGTLVDPYGGARDIASRTLRTVHPSSFEEDPTRLLRALVASAKHGLTPNESTRAEMAKNASRLDLESRERIQGELDKLFASNNPAGAIRLAQESGILKHVLPEVSSAWEFDQRNPHHNYPLGQHLLHVLEGASEQSDDPDLRLAALLHDIGKPASQWIGPEGGGHYYKHVDENGDQHGADHELVGADMAETRLRSLKYPNSRINRIRALIAGHMFPAFSSAKGARKFLNRAGEHADDLLTLRHADMYGKGTDAYQATKTPVDVMRELTDQARQAPVNQTQLALGGNELMQGLGLSPGPQVGQLKNYLMDQVLENPELNTPDALMGLAQGWRGV
jgi:poly(A) polymerase